MTHSSILMERIDPTLPLPVSGMRCDDCAMTHEVSQLPPWDAEGHHLESELRVGEHSVMTMRKMVTRPGHFQRTTALAGKIVTSRNRESSFLHNCKDGKWKRADSRMICKTCKRREDEGRKVISGKVAAGTTVRKDPKDGVPIWWKNRGAVWSRVNVWTRRRRRRTGPPCHEGCRRGR